MSNLLNTKQVAELLGIDRKTVLRYLHSGKLSGSKLGRDYRIPQASVEAFLNKSSSSRGDTGAAVIAIANQKGGVGKTATAYNLGVALQRDGHAVLLVDLDPQGALTSSAGIPQNAVKENIYHVLVNDVPADEVLRETEAGLAILPSTIDLSAAEIELVNMMQRELFLRDVLRPLRARYDYILIDCPPSLGLLTINALAAADEVLVPVPCEFLALRGLGLLLNTVERVQSRLNRRLRITGILPTMYDQRTIHHQEALAELQANFPGQVLNTVVKQTVRMKEAPAAGLSILDHAPSNDAAQAYKALAKEVNGRG